VRPGSGLGAVRESSPPRLLALARGARLLRAGPVVIPWRAAGPRGQTGRGLTARPRAAEFRAPAFRPPTLSPRDRLQQVYGRGKRQDGRGLWGRGEAGPCRRPGRGGRQRAAAGSRWRPGTCCPGAACPPPTVNEPSRRLAPGGPAAPGLSSATAGLLAAGHQAPNARPARVIVPKRARAATPSLAWPVGAGPMRHAVRRFVGPSSPAPWGNPTSILRSRKVKIPELPLSPGIMHPSSAAPLLHSTVQ
jgi:hypothetical protein